MAFEKKCFYDAPLHNFLTGHNDNNKCVKLMFWNKQIPGKKPASKLKPQFKGEKEKKIKIVIIQSHNTVHFSNNINSLYGWGWHLFLTD